MKRVADRDALDRLDRADRHRQAPVQALLPGDVRAEARHEPEGLHLEDAAERLVGLAQPVDLARPSRASPRRPGSAPASRRPPRSPRALSAPSRCGRVHRGDLDDVRVHAHAERAQERLAQRPAGHARGRLARGGALEDVAHVGLLVLLGAHEVGVAGARQVHLGDLLRDRPRVHPLLPVGVVAVGDLQRDRAAERAPVAHPAGDLGGVALDLHAPAATVAELAARHVVVQILRAQLEARRQALDDAGQAGAVRLAGGDQTEAHAALAYLLGARRLWRRRCSGLRGRRRQAPGDRRTRAHPCPLSNAARAARRVRRGAAVRARPSIRRGRRLRPGGGRVARGDAHDPQFVDGRRTACWKVFELLGLTGLQVDRLALRGAGQAGPRRRAGSLRRRA